MCCLLRMLVTLFATASAKHSASLILTCHSCRHYSACSCSNLKITCGRRRTARIPHKTNARTRIVHKHRIAREGKKAAENRRKAAATHLPATQPLRPAAALQRQEPLRSQDRRHHHFNPCAFRRAPPRGSRGRGW
jgi:hypothetical protein